MFASNISAEHFVGLAGSGFAVGMAMGGFEWMAVYCIVPLVVLFLPFYVRNRIYTVPEFLERRFGPGVRLLFSGLMVALSVLTKVSISLWASSIVFSDVLGWPRGWVIWGVGLVTCLYTMKGGLRAVVYTDALQTAVLLRGGRRADRHRPARRGRLVGPAGKAAGGDVLDGAARDRSRRALARHVHRRLHPRQLLLVDGPGARAARVRGQEPRRGPARRDLLRIPEARDAVPAGAPGARRQGAAPGPRRARPGLPHAARDADARRPAGADGRRHRGGADGSHQRHLQLGRDARHARLLPALPARGGRGAAGARRAHRRARPCSCSALCGRR